MRIIILMALLFSNNHVFSQSLLTNTFTYQGELKFNNVLVNGPFDFEFNVFDVATNGSLLETVVVEDVAVTNGVFTTPITLTNDLFTGNKIWLDIGVRVGTTTDPFDPLSPRQEVTSSPYAIHAQFVGADAVTGVQILNGTITASDVDTSSLQQRVGGSCASGQYMKSVNANGTVNCAVDMDTIAPAAWLVGGNDASTGDFIGINNDYPFVVKLLSKQVMKIDQRVVQVATTNPPMTTIYYRPNVTLGSENNAISGSSTDSTISGGSVNTINNSIAGTISGGRSNTVSGDRAVVPGGDNNVGGGDFSFAAGLYAIVRDAAASGDANGDEGTFIWSDATASFGNKFTSTGPNQFRVRATGGAYFEVSGSGLNPPGFDIEQKGASGVGLLVRQTSTDASLVLVNKGTGDIIKAFTGSGGGNLVFRVTNDGTVTADGNITSGGADFAEYLPTDEINLQAAEVVGLSNGKLTRDTSSAQRVMVISSNPAFVGNNDKQGNKGKALAAFTGQVAVKVIGSVKAGDWLMSSGENDGKAIAIQTSKLSSIDMNQIIGQAIEEDNNGQVKALVGLPQQALLAAQQQMIKKQQTQLQNQQQQIAKLQSQQQQILVQQQKTQELQQQLAEMLLVLKQNQQSELFAQNKEIQDE